MWCYAVRRSLCSIALSNPLYEVELNNVQHQLSPKYITKKESLETLNKTTLPRQTQYRA